MPVFIKDERYVLFPHVPKTGGTSLEQLFRRSGWKVHLRDMKSGPGTMNHVRRTSPQHMTAELLTQTLDLSRFELIFMVVREPIARFRSEYAMRQADQTKTGGRAVQRWAERVLERFERDPDTLDSHLRPQSEFHLVGSVVYRLEDGLSAAVNDLNGRFKLNLEMEIPRALTGTLRHGIASEDVEITPELRARLNALYAEDFSRFGY